ncbi:MAG: hypothetical protein LUH40_00450, partial [Clostridiales bacterium]|nr:hypothetical protein [Clostridiales bacterium]
MKKIVSVVMAVILACSSSVLYAYACNNTLKISEDNITHEVSDMLYGVFLEDISYAIDGGLCANLAANNSFEYESNTMYAWRTDGVSAEVLSEDYMNENNTNYLSVSGTGTVSNIGYVEYYDDYTWTMNEEKMNTPDMGFSEGETYTVSMYFKNIDFEGTVSVYLDSDSNKEPVELDVSQCGDWTQLTAEITSKASEDGALTFAIDGTGTLLMDFLSVIPQSSHGYDSDEWKYTSLRADLYQLLEDMHPAFIRFPGGCFAEGDSFDNIYDWKNSVLPLTERKQNYNLWQDLAVDRYYNNSYEIGYHEYLQLCDDLGAEPVPVFSAGVLCQGRVYPYESIAVGTEEFEELVQDILDFIEYCNGGTDTYWGALRAENGHPESFDLEYIAIGNENWGDIYWDNFAAIKEAINEAYPEIQIITTSGTWLDGDDFDYAWETVNSLYPDTIVDEHYYTIGGYLFENNDRYDSYDRDGGQVFVGEYAATADGVGTMQTKCNLWSAIEEASYMTGFERNSDIVKMTSYAPTFAKMNAQCWTINEIWFDSQTVAPSPSYYVQMLYSNNLGTEYVATEYDDDDIYQSITVDRENQIMYVKIVNTSSVVKSINIKLDGFGKVTAADAQVLTSYTKRACNTIGNITTVPTEKSLITNSKGLVYTASGYSVNVIRIAYGDGDIDSIYHLPEMPETTTYYTPAMQAIIDFFADIFKNIKNL